MTSTILWIWQGHSKRNLRRMQRRLKHRPKNQRKKRRPREESKLKLQRRNQRRPLLQQKAVKEGLIVVLMVLNLSSQRLSGLEVSNQALQIVTLLKAWPLHPILKPIQAPSLGGYLFPSSLQP